MEVGLVRSVDIDSEMQQAYLDYAMSVIVARALPDARDGLKPVHRRILYAMYDMGVRPNTAYKKSARIVGEVLGKYHPHGDAAVYDAMARMAQNFSMRYLLVDGQGNFGSVDGDPPAAMRYTEARMAALSDHMLADIQKNTVDFIDNFDGTLNEPDVLPSAFPNLLVNGATGIAVGMSTSIPPHNLSEVVDALKYMLANWDDLDEISVEDLMQFIQGPDFPTGGIIVQNAEEEAIKTAYGSGRGRVTVQARAHVEEMSRGRNRIIITELPYMTNKASLIERIADLVREERVDGIADLRDESDRQGLRVVIELNKNANPETVLQELFKSTSMRSTFSIIMLALVDGEPRMLSLKQSLRVYLEHRLTVAERRGKYDLDKARQRAHILEGLRVALKNLDEVIDLIRKSADADVARTKLMKRFKLTEVQAQAILDMPLRRLASLERKKIEEEYKELQALIKELESLLRSPKKMRGLVGDELQAIKDTYGDRRRTQIVHYNGESRSSAPLVVHDVTPEAMAWVSITTGGLVSRSLEDKAPKMSGGNAPRWLAHVNTRDTLYLVSETGETAAIPVHSVPETDDPAQGKPYYQVSPLEEKDHLAGIFNLPAKNNRPEGWFVLTGTRLGMVKKSAVEELPGPSAKPFTLVRVNEGDRFGWLHLTGGSAEILLATANGMAIRFSEEDIRPMGLVAAGVNGIKLEQDDEVVGMELAPKKGDFLFITSNGKAKRVKVDEFPTQGRYGKGVVAWKLPRGTRLLGVATGSSMTEITLHMDKLVPKSIRMKEAPAQGRTAQGKAIQDLKKGDEITALTVAIDLPRPGEPEKTAEAAAAPAAPKKARSTSDGKAAEGAAVTGAAPKKRSKASAAVGKEKKAAPKAATKVKPKSSAKSVTKEKPTAKTSKTNSKTAPKATAVKGTKKTTTSKSTTSKASKSDAKSASTKGSRAKTGSTKTGAASTGAGTSSRKTTRKPKQTEDKPKKTTTKKSSAKKATSTKSDEKKTTRKKKS